MVTALATRKARTMRGSLTDGRGEHMSIQWRLNGQSDRAEPSGEGKEHVCHFTSCDRTSKPLLHDLRERIKDRPLPLCRRHDHLEQPLLRRGADIYAVTGHNVTEINSDAMELAVWLSQLPSRPRPTEVGSPFEGILFPGAFSDANHRTTSASDTTDSPLPCRASP